MRLRDSDVGESSAYTSDKAMKAVPNNLERRTVIGLPRGEGDEAISPDLDGQQADHALRTLYRSAKGILPVDISARLNPIPAADAMEGPVIGSSCAPGISSTDDELQRFASWLDLYAVLEPLFIGEFVGICARWRSGEVEFIHDGPVLPAERVRSRLS